MQNFVSKFIEMEIVYNYYFNLFLSAPTHDIYRDVLTFSTRETIKFKN